MWFTHGALWVLISELDLHYLSEAKFWIQKWSIVLLVGWLGNCRQGARKGLVLQSQSIGPGCWESLKYEV